MSDIKFIFRINYLFTLRISLITILILSQILPAYSQSTNSGWIETASLPVARASHSSVVNGEFIYVLGGDDGVNPPFCPPSPFPNVACAVDTVLYAHLESDGSIREWKETVKLPDIRAHFSAVTYHDKIYVIGGHRLDGFAEGVSTSWFAEINHDGSIREWKATFGIPYDNFNYGIGLHKNRIYLLGGSNGYGPRDNVIFAEINPDGSIKEWKATLPLPKATEDPQIVIKNEKIFVIGGSRLSGDVYVGSTNEDGSVLEWKLYGKLPFGFSEHLVALIDNRIVVVGGNFEDKKLSQVYVSYIDNNDRLGWESDVPLPFGLVAHSLATRNDVLYVTGGYSDKGLVKDVIFTTIGGGILPSVLDLIIVPERVVIESGGIVAYTIFVNNIPPQTVMLSIEGLPKGVQAKLNPSSGVGDFSSELTINASSLALGSYDFKILARAGPSSKINNLILNINPFRIDVIPSQDQQYRGETKVREVKIVGKGTELVNINAKSKSGININFEPNEGVPPFTTNMRTFVYPTVSSGNYQIELSLERMDGKPVGTTSVDLTVNLPSRPTKSLVVDFVGITKIKSGQKINVTFTVIDRETSENIKDALISIYSPDLRFNPQSGLTSNTGTFVTEITPDKEGSFKLVASASKFDYATDTTGVQIEVGSNDLSITDIFTIIGAIAGLIGAIGFLVPYLRKRIKQTAVRQSSKKQLEGHTRLVIEANEKLDPKFSHVEAWLFYPPSISYAKRQRDPKKNLTRFKLVVLTDLKRAYRVGNYVMSLILLDKIRWHSDDEQDLKEWCEKRGYTFIDKDAIEQDLLAPYFHARIRGKKEIYKRGEPVLFETTYRGGLVNGFFDNEIVFPNGGSNWSWAPDTLPDTAPGTPGLLNGVVNKNSQWSWVIPSDAPSGKYQVFMRVYNHFGTKKREIAEQVEDTFSVA